MTYDYAKIAKEVIAAVGGAENIRSAAHCATRLRLIVADRGKAAKRPKWRAKTSCKRPSAPLATCLYPSSPPWWPPACYWAGRTWSRAGVGVHVLLEALA